MSERQQQLLRIGCLVLGALLVVRVAFLWLHLDTLRGVRVPPQPHWSPSEEPPPTNSVVKAGPGSRGDRPGTNSRATNLTQATGTNSAGSNTVALSGSNMVSGNYTGTNKAPANPLTLTNATNAAGTGAKTNSLGTNTAGISGTNSAATNALAGAAARPMPPGAVMPPGFPGFPGGPGGMRGGAPSKPARPLSPLVQARIDKITQSEMLAPIVRPPPMALLGIAGFDAFIRTPNGQPTMLRVNGESDGIKLLVIGTNRVLIEQGGEKKELMIFSGLGGESLLPK